MKNLFDKYGKKKAYGVSGGILVLIISLIVAICVVMSNQNKLVLNDKALVIELGDEVSLKPSVYLDEKVDRAIASETVLKSDLITNKGKYTLDTEKQTVITKDKKFLEVGKYDATLNYKKEELKFVIEVKDTKAPAFKDVLKEVVVEQDAEDVDFTKFFKAEDLSEFKITTNDKVVDLRKVGDYKLQVTAKDKYNNEESKEVKVRVLSLEDANKKDVLTKTIDGTVYQSKAMKKKIAEKQRVEEEKKAQEEIANSGSTGNGGSVNNGGGSSNGGNSNTGGGTPQAPAPQPNGISAVINTAYGFVGRTDMTCNDLVVQSYKLNNYDTPYNSTYYMGNNIGTNSSVLQVGDFLFMDGNSHVMLVTSINGSSITVVEGGINGSNVVTATHVVSGSTIIYNGIGGGSPITQIRRY